MKLTVIMGIDGSPINDPKQPPIVTPIGIIFQSIIMAISIWLPLQGYLEVNGYIPWLVQVITTWVFWGVMLLFSFTMIAIVNNRWRYIGSNWLNFLNIWIAYPVFWLLGNNYTSSYVWAMIVIVIMLAPWLVMVMRMLSAQRVWGIALAFLIYSIQGGFILAFIDQAIGNPWNGIWWAFQTITTVGYGDVIPQTYLGQVYGIIFMLGGLALFALTSATITYIFLQKHHAAERKRANKILNEFKKVADELHEIKKDIQGMQK